LKITGREFGTALAERVTVETTVPGGVQALLENTLYVTVPPRLKPPVSVAESLSFVPTMMLCEDNAVAMTGLDFWTFNGSQGDVAMLLLASPEYEPWKL